MFLFLKTVLRLAICAKSCSDSRVLKCGHSDVNIFGQFSLLKCPKWKGGSVIHRIRIWEVKRGVSWNYRENLNKPHISGYDWPAMCDCNWTAEFCDCSVWRISCCLSEYSKAWHSHRFGFSCSTFLHQCCIFIAATEACDRPDQPARCHSLSLYFKFYLDPEILWTQAWKLIFISHLTGIYRIPLLKWPTWCTITLYNTFIVIILYMFRATLCSSSGGQIVLTL